MREVKLQKIIDSVSEKTDLKVFAAGQFIDKKKIRFNRVNVLGLELSGFFKGLNPERIQVLDVFGWEFVKKLKEKEARSNLSELFSNPIPALVLTDGIKLPEKIKNLAEANGFPVLGSAESRWKFARIFDNELEKLLAPRGDIRGTMLEVFGVGVLIEGKSNVGKSECAIDLLNRGHRLVGDDLVDVTRRSGEILIARGKFPIAHRMELRGVGIVDIRELLGISAVKDFQKIELVVALEKWKPEKSYERLGLEENKKEILGAEVAYVEIPVAPGRNTAILVEAAVLNYRLRRRGVIPAHQLDREVIASFNKEDES